MLNLDVIVIVLQPGWDRVITERVQPAFFCSFTHQTFPKHPESPSMFTSKACFYIFAYCSLLCTVFCMRITQTVGSLSALFTCSLLFHLKVVGGELFGCPPYPRHILYSVQFLWREVCWGCEAECGGVKSKKCKLLSNVFMSESKLETAMAKKSKLYDNVA